MKQKIYIAGKMRGIKHYNFPAFDTAHKLLEQQGWDVVNPAELDRNHGFDPYALPHDHDWSTIPTDGFSFDDCVSRDIAAVRECDAIYLLRGWRDSVGARAEKALAEWLGKQIVYEDQSETTGEIRITDPTTGGQKGQKPERFDLLPAEPLEDIARVYGWGAAKYSDDNWRKGYSWKLSFGAMMRHSWSFWRGEDNDRESNLPHLAHAAWHCLTLLWFMRHRRQQDDRYSDAV